MIFAFTEGDRVPVPCRHCASLSTEVTITSGSHEARCGRCDRTTRILVSKKDGGWSVTTEIAEGLSPTAR